MSELSDEARQVALKTLISRVRRLCVDLGEPAANVVQIHDARELLELYNRLIEKAEANQRSLKHLMEQPPGPCAA